MSIFNMFYCSDIWTIKQIKIIGTGKMASQATHKVGILLNTDYNDDA